MKINLLKYKWYLLSVCMFAFGIIAISGRDYMVHGVHYAYGLQYDWSWHSLDMNIYALETNFVALASALVIRSFGGLIQAFVVYEVFIWSCGADLVFYGLWHNILRIAPQQETVFPIGNWVWMPFYNYFGVWSTWMQIALTFCSVTLAILCMVAIRRLYNKVVTNYSTTLHRYNI